MWKWEWKQATSSDRLTDETQTWHARRKPSADNRRHSGASRQITLPGEPPTGQPPCILASFLATLKPGEHRLPASIPKHTQLLLHLYGLPVSFRGAGAPGGPDRHQTLSNSPVVATEVTSRILIINGYITGYLRTLWLNVLQEVVGYINWWCIQTAKYIIYIYICVCVCMCVYVCVCVYIIQG